MVTKSKITEVKPGINALRLQHAYRQADYTTDELLAEFIDNSISAARKNIPVTVNISLNGNIMTYDDNGTGITRENLANALTLGSDQTYNPKDGMNEHGLGFKQATCRMGKFLSLESYGVDKDTYTVKGYDDHEFGLDFDRAMPLVEQSSLTTPGVQFKIELIPEMVTEFSDVDKLESLIERLGSKYQELLQEGKLELNLDINGRYVNINPCTQKLWNFKTGKPGALMDKVYKAKDGSWEARVIVGYTPDFKKHDIALKKAKLSEPASLYARSTQTNGFDLKVGKRIIQHGANKLAIAMSKNEILCCKHPTDNGVQGTIHFIKGFKTQPTKNRMTKNKALMELHSAIKHDIDDVVQDIHAYDNSLKVRRSPNLVMSSILRDAKIHKKRAKSVVHVAPELYKNSDIANAIVDKTTGTLYVETRIDKEPTKAQLMTMHDVAMQRIIEPNPLDLKKQINRIITVVSGKPSAPIAKFAAMLPMFTKLAEDYQVEIKHNELMTPSDLATHLSDSLNFK